MKLFSLPAAAYFLISATVLVPTAAKSLSFAVGIYCLVPDDHICHDYQHTINTIVETEFGQAMKEQGWDFPIEWVDNETPKERLLSWSPVHEELDDEDGEDEPPLGKSPGSIIGGPGGPGMPGIPQAINCVALCEQHPNCEYWCPIGGGRRMIQSPSEDDLSSAVALVDALESAAYLGHVKAASALHGQASGCMSALMEATCHAEAMPL